MTAVAPRKSALFLALLLVGGCRQPVRHPDIRAVLDAQVSAWNAGDLAAFMAHYWKSDELTFSTPDGALHGWEATFRRYEQRYPTAEAMGRLRFEDLEIARTGDGSAEAAGRFIVTRQDGIISGRFYLNLRRIDGRWVIVRDQTVRDGGGGMGARGREFHRRDAGATS